ncbi:MAG: SDR family oxidoreductase [Chitinophagales bacterium]|nr:SDR family oxidoreductase [Chitinophagales bacterium]MDW8274559.1 SDR family oxidoreductase [Chitinophagales bacterium]
MAQGLLQGKKGIIFGALDENSIAWRVALEAHRQGATFTLTNAPVALRLGTIQRLAEATQAKLIPADATVVEDLERLIQESQESLGGKIDFVLHSIGMSPNVRKGRPYTDLNYEWLIKTLDISAISLHKLLQVCYKADALNEWGSVVALTYIAAQRTFPSYGDMAEAKALLESVVRSFGYYYGIHRKVRINSVSQSPTKTTAGTGIKGFDTFYGFADKMSPLGNADADECAAFCVALFSDLCRKVTMQNIYHDGGFSSMGVSEPIMNIFSANPEGTK